MRRLPIIRHLRYFWHSYRLAKWTVFWQRIGYAPNEADFRRLRDIWEGKA